jgi:8-oxo-dGTP diphosphatase
MRRWQEKVTGMDTADREFLETYDASAYERPSVTVDVVVLTAAEGAIKALLVRRIEPPQAGSWALPGTFVRMGESLEDAALRALAEKAGITDVYLEQLCTFGAPARDPRTRVITVAYCALVSGERLAGRDLARLRVPWDGEEGGAVEALDRTGEPLDMAFDHAEVLGMAVKRMRGKLGYTAIGYQLLPETFTLRQLQDVHETVLGRPLNKDSFRRRMLASGEIEATGELETEVEHRPAEHYRFVERSAL